MTKAGEFLPVIIVGAGRSGTNVLRDCLTKFADFGTWPCDEIQPIWRHGNLAWPNDELTPEHATKSVKKFIHRAFHKQWRSLGKPKFLVEKTCANTLRVPFLNAVFPDAIYIHIIRNGVDVVPSAKKRWSGELELPSFSYFAAKARYIPWQDIPVYAWSFISKRLGKLTGKKQRLSTWGPRFENIDDWENKRLELLCAEQWAQCVTKATDAFATLPNERVITVYYEDFIADPEVVMKRILFGLNYEVSNDMIADAVKIVRVKPREDVKRVINDNELAEILVPVLNKFNYGIE